MSNDISSLPLSSECRERWLYGARPQRHFAAALLILAGSSTLPSCGGSDDTRTTYSDDIRPLFNRRCTTCHRQGGPSGIDIQNPFGAGDGLASGLVASKNFWKQRTPTLDVPDNNVVPGDPDQSFLLRKLGDPNEPPLPVDPDGPNGPLLPMAGSLMPLQLPHLSDAQVQLVSDWILAGAGRGDFPDTTNTPPQMHSFEQDIRIKIFGDETLIRNRNGVCDQASDDCPRCVYCHYSGSPNPLDLTDPFGADGLINIPTTYRAKATRVVPGHPEQSFLMDKIRADRPEGDVGAQMPYSYTPLSTAQIDSVRTWIAEGALP